MFNINTRKSAILLALLVLFTAGIGGVMAAAPTVDTESTDTTQTSEITDAGTQTYNDTTSTNLSWSADSANSSVEIMQDGETLYEASPDNYSEVNGTYYYNVTLADDTSDYDGLEVGAGENAALNVTFTNDTAASNPDTTNISYTFANSEDTAFIASENPEGAEDDQEGFLSSLNVFSSEDEDDVGTQLSTDTTTVTQNTSEVQLDTLSSNLTDAYATSTEDASEGELIWASYTSAAAGDDDARFLPVFYESADNDEHEWINTSEDVYATLSSDGETMTIHNPDALLDDDQSSATLDVTTVGDEKLGLGNSAEMYSNYDAGTLKTTIGAFSALDTNGDPEFVTDALEA